MCGCGGSVYKTCGCGAGLAAPLWRPCGGGSPAGWWSDERLPAAGLSLAAPFVDAVLGRNAGGVGDPVAGAKALLWLLPPTPPAGSDVSVHIDPFGTELPPVLGLHPGELFIAIASALAVVGGIGTAALQRALLQATDTSPRGFDLRGLLGGGKPVFEPPTLPPEWLLPPKRLQESLCAVSVTKAALGLGKFTIPTSDANGITGLSSRTGCPGQPLQILGAGFGATAPAGTTVLVPSRGGGCIAARVLSWSDKVVSVELPADVGAGCVGFLRSTGEGPSLEAIEQFAGEITRCFGPAMLRWGDKLSRFGVGVTPCPPCLPGDANRLLSGGSPTIDFFEASSPVVEPGTPVTLGWSCGNASSVSLQRIGVNGPWSAPPQPLAASGSVALGPFLGTRPVVATYQLTASNGCGSVRRIVNVLLSRRAPVAVTAIEVVQAVQRADNSLPLVANRRTSVRVFVSSGLGDGFDYGSGPNVLPGVRVRLRALDPARGLSIDAGLPWNLPHDAPAVPDRLLEDAALHFSLPLPACTGSVELQASVEANLPGGWTAVANGSVNVQFVPKPRQQILPILVADSLTPLPAPSLASLTNNLAGSQRYQPFAEDGFTLNPPLTMTTPPFVDLRTGFGWSLLTTMLTTAIATSPASAGVRCATVPQSPDYPWGGMAIPRILVTAPSLICQADSPSVFAHELGHAYGLMHVDCGGPAGPFDARLPLMTDEPGIDWSDRSFKPAGTNELMSYCPPDWTSTAQWNIVFGAIPI
jgi:hypothetical protein